MVWCTSSGLSCQWVKEVPVSQKAHGKSMSMKLWKCRYVKPNAGCISMKVGASEWGLERGECEDLYDLKTSSMHLGTSAPLKLRRLERSNGTKFSFKKINLSYFACEQKQEDVNCTVGWLRKRGQVVESVIQTARNQNHQNHKVKNLAPVIYSTINVTFRDSSTDCFGQLLCPNKPSALRLNKLIRSIK